MNQLYSNKNVFKKEEKNKIKMQKFLGRLTDGASQLECESLRHYLFRHRKWGESGEEREGPQGGVTEGRTRSERGWGAEAQLGPPRRWRAGVG